MNSFTNALGLDVGGARIGVARVNSIALMPEPLMVLKNDDRFVERLKQILVEYSIDLVVVGRPRNMKGELTEQSRTIERFTEAVIAPLGTKFEYFDETLSTQAASTRLTKKYGPEMEDALAAAVILEDYIAG